MKDPVEENAYISAGSNLGDRRANLTRAFNELATKDHIDVISVSSLYETEPWGWTDQPNYFNCVFKVRTALQPDDLLRLLKAIERVAGRKPGGERWSPRELDLDILIYGELIIDSSKLTIPHPELINRRFVLLPLVELCPDLAIPAKGRTVKQALMACVDRCSVELITEKWLP